MDIRCDGFGLVIFEIQNTLLANRIDWLDFFLVTFNLNEKKYVFLFDTAHTRCALNRK